MVVREFQIKSEIDNFLLEELGISAEVRRISLSIVENIKKQMLSIESRKIEDGVWVKSGYLSENLFGTKLSIAFKVYNFKDKATFQNLSDRYNQIFSSDSSYGDRLSPLWLNTYSISGCLQVDSALENIQHEIEHIFQQKNARKNLPEQKYYGLVRRNLNSPDKIERAISATLYYSYRFEADGFINGLSGYLNEIPHPVDWKSITNTDAYKALANFRNLTTFLQNNRKIVAPHLLQYNLSYDRFIKRLKSGERYFVRKISRVLALHRQFLNQKGIYIDKMNENFITLY